MSRSLTTFRPEPRHVRWVYAVATPVAMTVALVLGVVIETWRSHRRAADARDYERAQNRGEELARQMLRDGTLRARSPRKVAAFIAALAHADGILR